MFQYRFAQIRTIFLCLLLQVILIQNTRQIALPKTQINDPTLNSSVQENSSADQLQDGTPTSPFIVLMSSDTISIAQLPMILYGNISEIYRLSSEDVQDIELESVPENTVEDNDDDGDEGEEKSVEEGDDLKQQVRKQQQHENEPRADAREYEQQMPQTTSTTVNASMSLGKSEWQQQIAASGERDREEVWRPQQTAQTNTNRKNDSDSGADSEEATRDGQEEGGGGKQLGRPRRKRRSNSLSEDDYGDSGNNNNSAFADDDEAAAAAASNSTSDAQTSSRVNRALASDAQNVTSAQTNAAQQQQRLNLDGAGNVMAISSAPEDGDKIATGRQRPASLANIAASIQSSDAAQARRRVKFSDFDVHMALGYAFAADTAGRIHRFRLLSGSQARSSSASPTSENILENNNNNNNEEANAIDGAAVAGSSGGRFEFVVSRQSNESGVNDSRLNYSPSISSSSSSSGTATTSNSIQVDGNHADDYDRRGDAHKQGEILHHANRVSSNSSNADVTHEQFGDDGRQHPTISGGSVPSSTVGPSRGSPISGGSRVRLNGVQQSSGIAQPQVIWSRIKQLQRTHLPSATTAAAAAADQSKAARRQQLAAGAGAVGALSAKVDSSQMADEREEKISAVGGARRPQTQSEGVGHNEQQQQSNSSSQPGAPHLLRTEIAVDWLNNLLFVLDKCRLLVMDFDGAHELVLIDDFNLHNRPIDIKVDPINDFLFWLQPGKFHNTIYKLDLSVLSMPSATQKLVSNTLRLRQSLAATSENGSSGNFDASELVPLVSHHYAHPIITNLPKNTRIFTIDHKHSRIYVPLVASNRVTGDSEQSTANSRQDDAEIFASSSSDVTHLNSTDSESLASSSSSSSSMMIDDKNCSQSGEFVARESQILAYNLDGTDVGPFRTVGERSHIQNLDDIQDLTLDPEDNLLYWLTSGGKDLVEEFKENETIQPAQHNLNGRVYSKLMYFDNAGFSQPTTSKSRFNVRKIIHILSSSLSSNRPTRSEGFESDSGDEDVLAFSLKVRTHEGGAGAESTRLARNAPLIILGVTCLAVITVYLVYALIFQRSQQQQQHARRNDDTCREGSLSGGSSMDDGSQVDANSNGFINSNTISRWIAGPSVRSSHHTDTSTFNRGTSIANGQLSAYDIESTSNYNPTMSNAIDEHYRDNSDNLTFNNLSAAHQLAGLSEWPENIFDRSNKLYVPVEVLQDEALASIRRVSIDQLEIEKKSPLGEGHFGTVLQGTIKCTLHEKAYLLDKSQVNIPCTGAPISPDSLAPPSRSTRAFAISSASSGHGSSSSTSCEFTTANSYTDHTTTTTNADDYLTPKTTQLNSVSSDYCGDMPVAGSSSRADTDIVSFCDNTICRQPDATLNSTLTTNTKLKVAIKKLKDNASAKEKKDFLEEAKLLADCNHPNIVHLIGICLDRGTTLIVMELMLGGDLIRYMKENKPNSASSRTDTLTYDDLLKICLDIANGCCYLEDRDWIHRDLAARNCLVSSRKREERVVKLADFGMARDIFNETYYKKLNDTAVPVKWLAPECMIEQKFTKKSEVWSFGIVMWEVMGYCQEKPYDSVVLPFLKDYLVSGARLRKPDGCNDNMYRLMNQCWQLEPENRPTFHECRAMLIEIRNETKV